MSIAISAPLPGEHRIVKPSTEIITGDSHAARACRRLAAIWLCGAVAVIVLGRASELPAAPPNTAPGADSPLEEVQRLLSEGEPAAAAEALEPLLKDPPLGADLTLVLARLGRGYQRSGDTPEAAEAYWRAVEASQRPSADSLSTARKVIIRLTAASALVKHDRPAQALDCLRPICDASLQADPENRQLAAKMLLGIGSRALASGQWQLGRDAYMLASKQLSGQAQATARLGIAWSLAISGREPAAAADKLEEFIRHHEEHPDAPRAARARAACLSRAGQPQRAAEALSELLQRWPDDEVALEVVREHHRLPVAQVPGPIRRWVIAKASHRDSAGTLDAPTASLGLLIAADENNIQAWNVLARRLAAADETGQSTSDLLQRLTDSDRAADAERLATRLIAPSDGFQTTPAVREAACRWAGRTQRWSMLALASESQSPGAEDPSRTMAVERLFAESLMQTGRPSEARLWWKHLVDSRGADDFPTLLRCAEAATSVASVDDAAERIEAARGASAEDPQQRSLVDMLAAELAVRRLKFDDARALLERVVRGSESPSGLRARAQWQIGETFYLQQKFAAAIDAYRRVEGMDDSGHWTPAALVQAGKSFEQLGRTREAAVCYSSLVGRFADSPHARAARRRLAAIRPDTNAPQPALKR